jgi:hypothetical protein
MIMASRTESIDAHVTPAACRLLVNLAALLTHVTAKQASYG